MTVTRERREDVVESNEFAQAESPEATRDAPHDVEIVVPVYNEAVQLTERITELHRFLEESFPFRALITIVDNGSTDETLAVATGLASSLSGVAVLHLSRKGRGLALRSAWTQSTARVVAYMDVDLSTSLTALLPLVAPLLSGHRDVAFGSRLARGSHVVRGPKRELISRAYNLLLRVSLHGRFSDAQCGFKALRREAALKLLPLVRDDEWFFDTELLVTAERLHMRLSEVPVDWVDDPDSRVSIVPTAIKDLRGVWRISHGQATRVARGENHKASLSDGQVTTDQLLPFAGVGVISTLGFLLLFLAWRPVVGTLAANALALLLCTIFNTTLHWELSHRMHPHSQKRRFVAVAAARLHGELGSHNCGARRCAGCGRSVAGVRAPRRHPGLCRRRRVAILLPTCMGLSSCSGDDRQTLESIRLTQVDVDFPAGATSGGVAEADPAGPSWDPEKNQIGRSQVEQTQARAPSAPGTWIPSRLRPLIRPIAYFAVSRLVVLAATLAAKLAAPRLNPFRALTSGWDGYWYLTIAQHGYPHRISTRTTEADGPSSPRTPP